MPELIRVEDLTIAFSLRGGEHFTALNNISITVAKGEIVGIVGESGAGKSTIGKTALGLLDENAIIEQGSIRLDNLALEQLSETEYTPIRGKRIGYIYQNPMTALNPVLTIGEQLIESIETHTNKRRDNAKRYAIELLEQAEVPHAEDRLSKYPHQLSGGLCQTALDVTVQKSVLDTLKRLSKHRHIAVILITHDMGVVAEMCDSVYVLRHGELVEHGSANQVLGQPTAEYSRELMAAVPSIDKRLDRFAVPRKIHPSKAHKRALEFLLNRERSALPHSNFLLSVENLSKPFVSASTLVSKATSFKALVSASIPVKPSESLARVVLENLL